ncbi:MAG: glycosyl hydrolase [Mucilaginibacter polytrichastri]|nr:glycosyl hydrolase [Mucilaginibacter polytrichastri]
MQCSTPKDGIGSLKMGFAHPPDSAKPGVYWYFMDGNMTRESMTKDLEAMKEAGIGNLVFLEVNVGIPRGKVEFLSEEWLGLFGHAAREAKRLCIEITLGIGPGWTGSGGPWVKPQESMQHLVASATQTDPGSGDVLLPVPDPRKPFFGVGNLTPELKEEWSGFYEDVAVLAFPAAAKPDLVPDIDEKALYYRAPYTSQAGVKAHLPYLAVFPPSARAAVARKNVIDLSDKMDRNGRLHWKPESGRWTVMRFGRRNNGAVTRPAPFPGLGFEADKLDTVALEHHLAQYVGKLLEAAGSTADTSAGGIRRLHLDSWEMGAQNWSGSFRDEFKARRGYDPLPFYPVYSGLVVENRGISERFLWDLRQTAQELVLQNHAHAVKKYGEKRGLQLSIEPYDMNPTADLELGAVADVPMAEFWSKGLGFNSAFSVIESTSIGHVNGKSLIPAEAFTAENNEGWKQYPGSMKNQGDWAFAAGINRFVYHTFQNQFLPDSLRPGATMGPYGVHWDRNQTWWPMAGSYHDYISRCQFMLQQGRAVADILYLTPEGSPHVFRPPSDAMIGDTIADRREYNFDGCAPGQLLSADVDRGDVVFPGGARYRVLVLPLVETMTPAQLKKIGELIAGGATVIGNPPEQSPSLSGYPACDEEIRDLSLKIWGTEKQPEKLAVRSYGKGQIWFGAVLNSGASNLYPSYARVAAMLRSLKVQPDFLTTGPVRYTHRTSGNWDMYFVSNRTDHEISPDIWLRTANANVYLWDPLNGTRRYLPDHSRDAQGLRLTLKMSAWQSFFVLALRHKDPGGGKVLRISDERPFAELGGPWEVAFDPKWGGPEKITFDTLQDWTKHALPGVRFYSGTAVYRKTFDAPTGKSAGEKYMLDLGEVKNLARVRVNGRELAVLWTAPWRVDITPALKKKGNVLEVDVVNLWPNRLIGDASLPDDGVKDGKWPDWLLNGQPRPGKRYTFASHQFYNEKSPLLPSGLMGPVRIMITAK